MSAHNQQTSTDQPLQVFLCHSSKDKSIVRDFYRRLQTTGIVPWFDEEDLLPGQKWRTEIPKAVRAADIVLVCLSRNSVDRSGYAQKEIKLALDVADEQPEGSIFVIPVQLEECNIPDRLREQHWVNLFAARGYERLVKALRYRADQLGRVLPESVDLSIGQPVVPPPYHPAHDIIPVLFTRVTRWAYKSDMCSHNGSLRLRQHGTFLSFSRTCGSVSHMFVKKDARFRPAGGESGRLSRQMPGFGTDRVTPVIHTTYAVAMQTGRLMRWKPDSPAAAWYSFFLFHKNVALRATFL
jgi:hypothetical protein